MSISLKVRVTINTSLWDRGGFFYGIELSIPAKRERYYLLC